MSDIDLFNFEPYGYVEDPGTFDNTPPSDTNLDASVKIHTRARSFALQRQTMITRSTWSYILRPCRVPSSFFVYTDIDTFITVLYGRRCEISKISIDVFRSSMVYLPNLPALVPPRIINLHGQCTKMVAHIALPRLC